MPMSNARACVRAHVRVASGGSSRTTWRTTRESYIPQRQNHGVFASRGARCHRLAVMQPCLGDFSSQPHRSETTLLSCTGEKTSLLK